MRQLSNIYYQVSLFQKDLQQATGAVTIRINGLGMPFGNVLIPPIAPMSVHVVQKRNLIHTGWSTNASKKAVTDIKLSIETLEKQWFL